MTEMRFVMGIAYQAGPDPNIMRGQDGGRDYFTAEELEKAAHSFLRNGPVVGTFHVDGTEGSATVVESFIYRNDKHPWEAGSGVVVKAGDWCIGAILDEASWQLFKSGRVTGWSPQGSARRIRSS